MKHHFIDIYSEKDSAIHRLGARLKIILALAFLLVVVFTPPTAFALIGIYFAFIVTALMISSVPPMHIIKRTLIVLPFVFVVLFTKKPLLIWSVISKSILCTLTMFLLISTTRFDAILRSLAAMKVPPLFIMTLSFMYRYIFILTDEYERMARAKKSRSFGGGGSKWFHFKALCNMAGSLFLRAFERGENVYLAMCARGFNGKIKDAK